MNPLKKSLVPKIACSAAVVLLCILMLPNGRAQEPEQKYTMEEYKAFEAIGAEPEAAKKTALIMQFLKERPQSTLRPNVLGAYQSLMTSLQSAKKWGDLISAGEQFLALTPDDFYTVALLATGYQETKNYGKFVTAGEKVFEKGPSGNLAYYLAKAYLELRNQAKFLQWGEKTISLIPDNHEMLLEMTKQYGDARKFQLAIKTGKTCLKVIQAATKPEATPDKSWKDYVTNVNATCYYIIGYGSAELKDYNSAVANLETSTKYYKRNEMAYYRMAESFWQLNNIGQAMLNFAKAYLLGGNVSKPAKQHLDNLWKTTHQQSLKGQEVVIAKAKEELSR
jgi:tetratricopeptide (TPR) repeat protein